MIKKSRVSRTMSTRKNSTRRSSKSKYTKKKGKQYKINVYAKNMDYIYTNDDAKTGNGKYDINKDRYKILLSQLSEALGENQWLKYSKDKYKPIVHVDKHNLPKFGNTSYKPFGSYYSKGGWLFHYDNCCILDREIIFIEVDYDTIYRITGSSPFKSPIKNSLYENNLLNFMKKYGVNFGKDKCEPGCFDYDTKDECNKPNTSCKWDTNKYNQNTNNKGMCIDTPSCSKFKTKAKCNTNKDYDCTFIETYKKINWKDLYKKYNGFALYPYPEYKMIEQLKKDGFVFTMYDVETLCLWDHTPVVKHYNLGTIRDILKETGLNNKDIEDIHKNKNLEFYTTFITQLIAKIKKINAKE